jgi:hypothetical protein
MPCEGDYVVGVESANIKVANRAELRATGRLPMLEPGEARDRELEIAVLEGRQEIDDFALETARIRGG